MHYGLDATETAPAHGIPRAWGYLASLIGTHTGRHDDWHVTSDDIPAGNKRAFRIVADALPGTRRIGRKRIVALGVWLAAITAWRLGLPPLPVGHGTR